MSIVDSISYGHGKSRYLSNWLMDYFTDKDISI